MRILIDTNVILDILLKREEFVSISQAALEKSINQGDMLFFSSSAVTDIYYLIRKNTGSREKALNAIKQLAEFLTFATVDENCIMEAMLSKISDYEDAVVDVVASRANVDYIMTRNIEDFKNSDNNVISPMEYLTI